jgi:phosphoserine phosphatase
LPVQSRFDRARRRLRLRRDPLGLLEGLSLAEVEAALSNVALRPGVGELLVDLRTGGTRTAILTGGFERGVAAALDRAGAGVDRVVANRLVDDGERFTGAVEGPLVEGSKDDALREPCEDFGGGAEDHTDELRFGGGLQW